MNVEVPFVDEESHWSVVRVTGPDTICKPVLKYLLIRLIDNEKPFNVRFYKEGPET